MENELVQQIDRLISMYQWSMGTFIAILALVLGFLGILQWRLSSKQIEKIKSDIEKQMVETYELDKLKSYEKKSKDTNSKIDNITTALINMSSGGSQGSYEYFIESQLLNILGSLFIYEDNKIPIKVANLALDRTILITSRASEKENGYSFTENSKRACNTIYKILKDQSDSTITESDSFKQLEKQKNELNEFN